MEELNSVRIAEEFLSFVTEMGIEGERKNMLLALSLEQKRNMLEAQKQTVQANTDEIVASIMAAKKPFRGMYSIVEIDHCVEVLNQARFSFSTLTEKSVESIARKRIAEEVWEIVIMLSPQERVEKSQTYTTIHESKQNKPVFKILEPAVKLFKCMVKSPAMIKYIKRNEKLAESIISVFPSQYIAISELILDILTKTTNAHTHSVLKYFLSTNTKKDHISCVPLCALRLKQMLDEIYYNLSLGTITPDFAVMFVQLLVSLYTESPLVGIMVDSMLRFCGISKVLTTLEQKVPEAKRLVKELVTVQEKCREMASQIDVRELHSKEAPAETKADIDSIVNIVSVLYRVNSSRVYDVLLYIRACVLEEASQKNKERAKIEEERNIRVKEIKQVQNVCVCGGIKPLESKTAKEDPENKQSALSKSEKVSTKPIESFSPASIQPENTPKEALGGKSLEEGTPSPSQAMPTERSPSLHTDKESSQEDLSSLSPEQASMASLKTQNTAPAEADKDKKKDRHEGIEELGKSIENLGIGRSTPEACVSSPSVSAVPSSLKPTASPSLLSKPRTGPPPPPSAPVTPRPPGMPSAPVTPRPPGMPSAPVTPRPPGMPSVPGGLKPPGMPGAPGGLKPPGMPGMPGAPGGGAPSPGPRSQYIKKACELHPKNSQKISFDLHMRKPGQAGLWAQIDKKELSVFSEKDFSGFTRTKTETISKIITEKKLEETGIICKKRCKAIDIVLARVKMPLVQLVQRVDELNEASFTETLLLGLLSNYPTEEELTMIRVYSVKLVPEIFYKYAEEVSHFKEKLTLLYTKLTLPSINNTLIPNIEKLVGGCRVIIESKNVYKLFRVLLGAINVLNAGGATEGAWGVKICAFNLILENKKLTEVIQKKLVSIQLDLSKEVQILKEIILVSPDVIEIECKEYRSKTEVLNIPGLNEAQKTAIEPIRHTLSALDKAYQEWKNTLNRLRDFFNEKDISGGQVHVISRFIVALASPPASSSK
ncbi:hypothetical protein NECID01_1059 [Nematocida sp. AWRm77]|nr:hypothetical protein NECID01_1059 [Nematocida sp. AWRm77]